MKKKGFLDFYNTYAPTGKLPSTHVGVAGLCFSFNPDYEFMDSPYSSKEHIEILELFTPIYPSDFNTYRCDWTMWGKENVWEEPDNFNTFRQTVVLFCAAIKNELSDE